MDVARAMVFAPSPLLTVTVEARPDERAEIHLHGGGQGVWIARMLATLGLDVTLCGPFGGETGAVLVPLIERDGVRVGVARAAADNGSYVHDRRRGDRIVVASKPSPALQRHELDQLYDRALVEGIDADVAVLGGPDHEHVLPADTYRRLVADLREEDVPVVVDLSGPFLTEAVAGGVTLVKVSHEQLIDDGRAGSDGPQELSTAARGLASEGAVHVVVSRAERPALALVDGRVLEVQMPAFERVDHRGAGDSMTAGIAASLAHGTNVEDALRMGAAAGALNTTRRGLATGERELIERLAGRVEVRAAG